MIETYIKKKSWSSYRYIAHKKTFVEENNTYKFSIMFAVYDYNNDRIILDNHYNNIEIIVINIAEKGDGVHEGYFPHDCNTRVLFTITEW